MAGDVHAKSVARKNTQALVHITHADAVNVNLGHAIFRYSSAIILNFDHQVGVDRGCAYGNFASLELFRQSVFDRVFDDRLEEHAGHKSLERLLVHLLRDPEVIAPEPGHFDIQIIVEKIELLAQRNDCLLYTSPSPRDRQKTRMPTSA